MGTMEEKLNYLEETKRLIRNAIIGKGVDVPENTPFREYAEKINIIVVAIEPISTGTPESPIGTT
ncbi:MAG: hypothetical protein RR961_06260 [Eubacterium sp.]